MDPYDLSLLEGSGSTTVSDVGMIVSITGQMFAHSYHYEGGHFLSSLGSPPIAGYFCEFGGSLQAERVGEQCSVKENAPFFC